MLAMSDEEFEETPPAFAAGTSLEVNSNGSLDAATPQLQDSNANNNEISAMAAEFPSVRNLIRKFDSLGSGSQPTKTKSPMMLQPKNHELVKDRSSETAGTPNTAVTMSIVVEPAAVPKQLPNPDGGDSVSASDDLPRVKDSGPVSNGGPMLNSDMTANSIPEANSDLALREVANQKEEVSVAVYERSEIKNCEAGLDSVSAYAEANLIDASTMGTHHHEEHQVSDCEEEEMYSASAGCTFDGGEAAVANTRTESVEEAVKPDNVPPALAVEGAESDEEVATDTAEEHEAAEAVGDTGAADSFEEAMEALEDAIMERAAEESQQPVVSVSVSASAVTSVSASSEEEAAKRPLKACAKLVSGERKPSKQQQQRRLRAGGSAASATTDFMTASSPKKRRLLLSNCARTLKNKVLDASRSMMSLVSRADEPVGRTRSHASASVSATSGSTSPSRVAIKTPVSSIASAPTTALDSAPASAPSLAPDFALTSASASAPASAPDSAPTSAPASSFDSESPGESTAASTALSAVVVAGTSLVSPKSPQPNLLYDSDEEPLLEPDFPDLQENNSALHRYTEDEPERAAKQQKCSGGRTREVSSASSENQSATLCWQVKDAASAARMSFTFVASSTAASAPPPSSSASRMASGTASTVPAGPPQTGPVDAGKVSEVAAYFNFGVVDENIVSSLADLSAVARVASIQDGPRFCRLVRLREMS